MRGLVKFNKKITQKGPTYSKILDEVEVKVDKIGHKASIPIVSSFPLLNFTAFASLPCLLRTYKTVKLTSPRLNVLERKEKNPFLILQRANVIYFLHPTFVTNPAKLLRLKIHVYILRCF